MRSVCLLMLFALLVLCMRLAPRDRDMLRQDSPSERFAWEAARRLPAGASQVDPAWLARASAARQPLLRTIAKRAAAWTWMGPRQLAGRTRALVVEPRAPYRVFAGAASGGVFVSSDEGVHWTFAGDGLAHLSIGALAMDPRNSQVLLAGTGELYRNTEHPYSAMRGGGVYKTLDGGLHWSPWTATQNADFSYVADIVISPLNSARAYVASNSGVWRSNDGGVTLQRLLSPSSADLARYEGCTDLELRVEGAREVLLASCSSRSTADRYYLHGTLLPGACAGPCPAAVFLSADASGAEVSFSQVLSEPGMGRTSLAVAASQPQTLYALSASILPGPDRDNDRVGDYDNGLHALFRSDDGGHTWRATLRNTGNGELLSTYLLHNLVGVENNRCNFGEAGNYFLTAGWYDQALAVDPLDPERVWVGGVDLFRSDNGGISFGIASYWWLPPGQPGADHADHHALVFHPAYDGAGNSKLFVGNDGGVSLTSHARAEVSRGLDAPCRPVGDVVQFRASQDGLGSSQFYHGSVSADGQRLLAGAQDNGTWLGDGMNWRHVFGGDGSYSAIHPRNPDRVYVSYQRGNIFRADDGARGGQASFTSVRNGITDRGLFITPFELDASTPDNLWLGTTRVWRSRNAGTSWQAASPTFGSRFADQVNALATHHAAPGLVVVGTGSAIYRNTSAYNTGSNSVWNSVIPRAGWVSSLSFDPRDARVLYATYSTFGGAHVWRSNDAGVSFSPVDGNLPDLPVHSIVIDPQDSQRLYVGTDLGLFVSADGGTTWSAEQTGFGGAIVEKLAINTTPPHFLHAFTYGRGVWRVALTDLDAQAIPRADPQYTGHWWNPAQSGQGVHMEVLDGDAGPRLLVAWYTYAQGEPLWLYGVGPLLGNRATVPLEALTGGQFPPRFRSEQVQASAFDQVTVRFFGPDRAELQHRAGSLTLESLARPDFAAARPANTLSACHSGNWYDPAQPGQGLSVIVHPRAAGSELLLVWYVYQDGKPLYLVGNGTVDGSRASMPAYRTAGGQFGPAFSSAAVRTSLFGTLTFSISGAQEGELRWQATDAALGSGSMPLRRLTQAAGLACR